MLFHQADHLCKLKTKEALILILVDLRNLFSSTQKSDQLKQPFTLKKASNTKNEEECNHGKFLLFG